MLNAPPMPGWMRTGAILLAFLAFVGVARVFQVAVAAILISLLSFGLVYSIARLFSLADGIAVIATAVTGLALFKLLESLVNIALEDSCPRLADGAQGMRGLCMLLRFRLLLVLVLAVVASPPVRGADSPRPTSPSSSCTARTRPQGTAIRRGGKELRPRLLMPLYTGDEVFLRDAASRIVLETEGGTEQSVPVPAPVSRSRAMPLPMADSGRCWARSRMRSAVSQAAQRPTT